MLLEDPATGQLMVALGGGIAKFNVEVERTRVNKANETVLEKNWQVPDFSEYYIVARVFLLWIWLHHLALIQKTEVWLILNLDGVIALLDLSVDFSLDETPTRMNIVDVPRINGNYIPIVNRGYMWRDDRGNIYLAGGHFYEQAYWDESRYYVRKEEIPDLSIWMYNIDQSTWTEIKPDPASNMQRLISSAAISIPGLNQSYAFA